MEGELLFMKAGERGEIPTNVTQPFIYVFTFKQLNIYIVVLSFLGLLRIVCVSD